MISCCCSENLFQWRTSACTFSPTYTLTVTKRCARLALHAAARDCLPLPESSTSGPITSFRSKSTNGFFLSFPKLLHKKPVDWLQLVTLCCLELAQQELQQRLPDRPSPALESEELLQREHAPPLVMPCGFCTLWLGLPSRDPTVALSLDSTSSSSHKVALSKRARSRRMHKAVSSI